MCWLYPTYCKITQHRLIFWPKRIHVREDSAPPFAVGSNDFVLQKVPVTYYLESNAFNTTGLTDKTAFLS